MTKNEEILGMFHKFNAMSRRGKHPPEFMPPPPPERDGMPPPPPPPHAREHGRVRLMNMLMDEGEMSQREIAQRLEIRPQSLSELLVKMEADGMIIRRQDEEDKRVSVVALTEQGKTQLSVLREANRNRAEQILSPLSEDEKDILLAIMKKLTEKDTEE